LAGEGLPCLRHGGMGLGSRLWTLGATPQPANHGGTEAQSREGRDLFEGSQFPFPLPFQMPSLCLGLSVVQPAFPRTPILEGRCLRPCWRTTREPESAAVDEPPQRRKFELALMDIRRCLVDPPMKDRADALRRAARQVDRFAESLAYDPESTRALIDTIRAVRDSPGRGGNVAEAKLMQTLASIAFWGEGEESDVPPTDTRKRPEVLRDLAAYAMECLAFRRPRDAFGGRRRSIAFEILTDVDPHVDLPEAVRVARSIALSASGDDCRGALEFLKARYERRGEEPDEELVDGLLRVADRTQSRSIVFGALDLLVESGGISELQALDRMDEWKERNEIRG
jgi:hypothetical protein